MTLIFLKWVQKLACPFWEGEVNRTVAMRGRTAVHPRCRQVATPPTPQSSPAEWQQCMIHAAHSSPNSTKY